MCCVLYCVVLFSVLCCIVLCFIVLCSEMYTVRGVAMHTHMQYSCIRADNIKIELYGKCRRGCASDGANLLSFKMSHGTNFWLV